MQYWKSIFLFFQGGGEFAVQFPIQLPVPGGPAGGVSDDFFYIFIVIGGQRFMAGLEIDDLAIAPGEGAQRAEYIG